MLFVYLIRTIHIEYALCSKHYPLEKHYSFFFSLPFDFRKVLCAMYCAMLRSFVCVCVLMYYVCFRVRWDLRWIWRNCRLKDRLEEGEEKKQIKREGYAHDRENGWNGREPKNQKPKKKQRQTEKEKGGTVTRRRTKFCEFMRKGQRKDDLWRKKRVFLIREDEEEGYSSLSLSLSLSLFLSRFLVTRSRYDFRRLPTEKNNYILFLFSLKRLEEPHNVYLEISNISMPDHRDQALSLAPLGVRKRERRQIWRNNGGTCPAFLLAAAKIAEKKKKKKKNCPTHKKKGYIVTNKR